MRISTITEGEKYVALALLFIWLAFEFPSFMVMNICRYSNQGGI